MVKNMLLDKKNEDNKEEDNNKNKNKEVNENLEEDESSFLIAEKEKFYEEEDVSLEVKNVLDDVFTSMVDNVIEVQKSDLIEEINKVDTGISNNTESIMEIEELESIGKSKDLEVEELKGVLGDSLEDLEKEDFKTFKHKLTLVKELESFHENKLKELEEKIKVYDKKNRDLEKKSQEYEDIKEKLEEKRNNYEQMVKEFEQKSLDLEKSKGEFKERSKQLEKNVLESEDRNKKLEEARKQFMELSKKIEEKKIDLGKREDKLERLERFLEESKYELEKRRIEFQQAKLEFAKVKTELEIREKELIIRDSTSEVKKEEAEVISVEKLEEEKGKVEFLHDLLQELSTEGSFQSCFLIDGKGMMISEYAKIKLDAIAVAAMFSLITTTVLRTVNSLSLHELEYFKLSSTSGEFVLKNIDIKDYERNFILLAYYDDSDSTIIDSDQKIDKKTIKNILNSVKKDFYEFREGKKISWIFDNLTDKVKFLKQKYSTEEGDLEIIRITLLNKTSIKIKELFEM